ncbi:hypothetical protein HAX54_015880 [Datura stramonium]|uniref:EF-hand domain-containing protein n=1 Tax=Datura stramonium TaxID=4076 RepID=A0ABS8UHY8_DATST|nr:hypothetical protein [Datura stramonium]
MVMPSKKTSYRSVSASGKNEMTLKEFKEWLKEFDTDNNGKISKEELREAIRATGAWFCGFKSKKAVKYADTNRNGVIDENEIDNLVHFAQKHLGIRIVSYH